MIVYDLLMSTSFPFVTSVRGMFLFNDELNANNDVSDTIQSVSVFFGRKQKKKNQIVVGHFADFFVMTMTVNRDVDE
jgi:hypothetical protein